MGEGGALAGGARDDQTVVPAFRGEVGGQLHGTVKVERSVSVERHHGGQHPPEGGNGSRHGPNAATESARADPVRKIARTIAAMLAAEAVFTEGR